LKDAVYVRTQDLVEREKIQENLLTNRISEINRQMFFIKKKFEKEKKMLLITIKDVINKVISKRRVEFKRLWLKYVKISRSIENLQHKENCRLRYLERKKIKIPKSSKIPLKIFSQKIPLKFFLKKSL